MAKQQNLKENLDSQTRLNELTRSYVSGMPNRITGIEITWHNLVHQHWCKEKAQELHRTLHSLTGSSGTYGFQEVSNLSNSIEHRIQECIELQCPPDISQIAQISADLGALKILIYKIIRKQMRSVVPSDITNTHVYTQSQIIYLLETDDAQTRKIVSELKKSGYQVSIYSDPKELGSSILSHRPDAIIVNLDFLSQNPETTTILQETQQTLNSIIPLLFLSSNDEFDSRLLAARTEGKGYFVKPVDISSLVKCLDHITHRKTDKPFRILLIDDDIDTSARYAEVMRDSAMNVMVLNDPKDTINATIDFCPDLILLDLYMPDCSGQELATIIRQQDAFLNIPIVYLSSEKDIKKQLIALHNGGSDFLTKPVSDHHLISVITSHVSRARALDKLISRDSLSDLLKHSCLNDELNKELLRANRTSICFSFVMIDIDNLKAINDNYGYMMGDKIIKSLSRLLQQELRISDRIGRYDGEEFGIILPNCQTEDAGRTINRIRHKLEKTIFSAEDTKFSVTFSAGIASYPDYTSLEKLVHAADLALYEAKDRGRNRIFIITDDGFSLASH